MRKMLGEILERLTGSFLNSLPEVLLLIMITSLATASRHYWMMDLRQRTVCGADKEPEDYTGL